MYVLGPATLHVRHGIKKYEHPARGVLAFVFNYLTRGTIFCHDKITNEAETLTNSL